MESSDSSENLTEEIPRPISVNRNQPDIDWPSPLTPSRESSRELMADPTEIDGHKTPYWMSTDVVVRDVKSAWSSLRKGVFDQSDFASSRCRALPNFRAHLISEMKVLVAALEDNFGPFENVEIEVLKVEHRSTEFAEVTTQLMLNGASITAPGTQDLVLEDGRWRADNCDPRELRVGHECSAAFGDEHRGKCIAFWQEVVKPSGCDFENPNFVEDFAGASFGPEPLVDATAWNHFAKSCFLPDGELSVGLNQPLEDL